MRKWRSTTIPMRVEVRKPDFQPLSSLRSLDLTRLSKGNHKVEIGFMDTGGCRNLVRAVIRNGIVTGCEVEPCKHSDTPAPPEVLSVFAKARTKVKVPKWKPIPVARLLGVETGNPNPLPDCFMVCWKGVCYVCCNTPKPHCFESTIYTGPL